MLQSELADIDRDNSLRSIDVYMDIMSPYCYLAQINLPSLAERHGFELVYHPMHIATAKMAAGNFGPSNIEVPSKIKALRQDIDRWARRYGVPFSFPSGFNGEFWNIAALHAIDRGRAVYYYNAAYRELWGKGQDPANLVLLAQVAVESGLDAAETIAFAESAEGRGRFGRSCVEAHNAGVFGAPIMLVDENIFWGNDRLDFLEEYLIELKTISNSIN